MDIKQTLNKVKANKYAFVGTSAFGSLLIGIGITGVAMSPSYAYVVGGISGNFNSKSAAEAWIENHIKEDIVNYRSVGGEFLIHEDEWSPYVFSIYSGLFGSDITYFTDQEVVKDDTGLITTIVDARTEADYIDIYEDANGDIDQDLDSTIASHLQTIARHSNEFTGTDFTAQFDTAAEAEQHWEDTTVNRHDFGQRAEYQFNGEPWNPDSDDAFDTAVENEIRNNIQHTAAVASTPGTESDYLASGDFIIDRDAWLAANEGSIAGDYNTSLAYESNRDEWILDNPDFGNTGQDAFWTYQGNDYSSSLQAENHVRTYIATQYNIRSRFSYIDGQYVYDTMQEARDAFRATLNRAGTSTEVTYFFSEGLINVAHGLDQTTVENGIEARLNTQQGFSTASGNYDSYGITEVIKYEYNTSGDVYYDTEKSIANAFEIDSNIQYTEVKVMQYYFEFDDEQVMFETEDELISFWREQIKRIKE